MNAQTLGVALDDMEAQAVVNMVVDTIAEGVVKTINLTLRAVEADTLHETPPEKLREEEEGRILDTLRDVEAKALEDTLSDQEAAPTTLGYTVGDVEARHWSTPWLMRNRQCGAQVLLRHTRRF